jgi:WD40 repeat protein
MAFSADGTRLLSGGTDKALKLWDATTGHLIRTFVGHTGAVTSVAFSPDDARLVSASEDRTLKVWDAAGARLIHSLAGHTGKINSVAFSSDGAWVLSGSNDKTMKLWDAAAGTLVHTFAGHTGDVISVAFSPVGRRVLSLGYDNTIKLWDAATGGLVHTFEEQSGQILVAAFSPDGSRVLSASATTIKLWDAATGTPLLTIDAHPAMIAQRLPTVGPSSKGSSRPRRPVDRTYVYWDNKWVAFSPDGSLIGSRGASNTMKLWDAATGALVRTFEGHSRSVNSVAFSPDGRRVLSGGADGTMKLWDATTGALLHSLKGRPARSVALSPDGSRVLSDTALWDADTGSLLRTLAEQQDLRPTRITNLLAFSPDGSRAVSGDSAGTMKMLNMETGALAHTFGGNSEQATNVVFSPNGARVLSRNHSGEWKLWDAATGTVVRTFGNALFSPDGSRVASHSGYDKTVKLWDAATGAPLRTLEGHSGGVDSVAFSPDGGHVLSGSDDKTLKLWDAATGTLVRSFEGHAGSVWSVAFSTDGRRVLSRSRDGTAILWDAATGTLIRSAAKVGAAAFSPDSGRVVVDLDGKLGLWDAADGAVLRIFGESGGIWQVAFSADGRRLLSKGSADWTMKLWDATSGALLRSFGGASVVLSPDGSRLLSHGYVDNTLKLWDSATGALLHTLEGHFAFVISAAFSPDGQRILSVSDDATTRIWDVTTGRPLAVLMDGQGAAWLAMTSAGFFSASRKGTGMLAVVRGHASYSVMQFYDHLHRPDLVEELLKGDPEGKHKDAARRLNLEKILDSGSAPRIELLPNKTEKSGDIVKLAARLVDEGGGIGPKVLWRVNGKTLGATAPPGLGRPFSLGDYVVMEQTFTVDPSKTNEVEIIAYNGKGWLATHPLRFIVDAWGVAEKERPRLFVLAIGVDKYAKPEWQLRYAAKDASTLAEALKLVGSPLFSAVEVKTLIDAEVTEGGIAAEFDRLAGRVKARDVFVLFLGGHGRSFAGEGWYYLPQNFDPAKGHRFEKDAIASARLRDWLAMVPAEKNLVVLDACESGAFDAFRGGDRERETVMAQLEYSTGRNYITAAPAGKAAYEGHKGHGVLTYAILEALHRPKGAEAEPVSVFGLATFISREVPAISERTFGIRQQPRFTPTGDDFPLGVRASVLKDAPPPIPTKGTHVNLSRLDVFRQTGGKGGVVLRLQPLTSVAIIRSERGWAHIARDGKALGYVRERQLKKLN